MSVKVRVLGATRIFETRWRAKKSAFSDAEVSWASRLKALKRFAI
jgi:hypothetical protein